MRNHGSVTTAMLPTIVIHSHLLANKSFSISVSSTITFSFASNKIIHPSPWIPKLRSWRTRKLFRTNVWQKRKHYVINLRFLGVFWVFYLPAFGSVLAVATAAIIMKASRSQNRARSVRVAWTVISSNISSFFSFSTVSIRRSLLIRRVSTGWLLKLLTYSDSRLTERLNGYLHRHCLSQRAPQAPNRW